MKEYVRPELNTSPSIAVSRRHPLLVFNRSDEQVIRVALPGQGAQDVPPGQEMPPQALSEPTPPPDRHVVFDDPQSWAPFGVLRPLARRNPDGGLSLDFPAFPGGSLAETGLSHRVPDLTAVSSIAMAIEGEGQTSLPLGTRFLLRLSSTQTGRAYETELPYSTQGKQTISFDLAGDLKISSARRRQEIDRLALVITGLKWPHSEWTVRSLHFQTAVPRSKEH